MDLDFIITSDARQSELEEAMATAGFRRRVDQYFHPECRFYVEFPPGPLAIGGDYRIVPIERSVGRLTILTLSATDSCRDRLAAFLHWGDRQSLSTAVAIALRNPVDMDAMRAWADREGRPERFLQFVDRLGEAKKRRRARKSKG